MFNNLHCFMYPPSNTGQSIKLSCGSSMVSFTKIKTNLPTFRVRSFFFNVRGMFSKGFSNAPTLQTLEEKHVMFVKCNVIFNKKIPGKP